MYQFLITCGLPNEELARIWYVVKVEPMVVMKGNGNDDDVDHVLTIGIWQDFFLRKNIRGRNNIVLVANFV
jgi:hypothetical protein